MTERRAVILLNATQTPNYPLNLGYVATYAAADEQIRSAFDMYVLRFDPRESAERDAVLEQVCDLDPLLIGFGQYVWNAASNLAMARSILERRPAALTVLGGPHVSSVKYATSFLRRVDFVDFLVRGEGEIAFRALLHHLREHPDLDPARLAEVPGLSYRIGDRIAHNEQVRLPTLEDIPSPLLWHDQEDFPIGGDGLDLHNYAEALIETNRGCPFRCAFCYWGVGNQKIARFSEARVAREIDYILSKGVHRIFLADANWGILPRDLELTKMVCDKSLEARARGGRGISRFIVNWNKNVTDRAIEMVEMLAGAGIQSSVTVAYQTLNPVAAELSKRESITIDAGGAFLRRAGERNVSVYTDLIWGLPGEAYEDFVEGIERLVDMGMPHIVVYPLLIIPGTDFYDNSEEYGFETIEDGEAWRLLQQAEPGFPMPKSESESGFSDALRVIAHERMTRASHQQGFKTICANVVLHLVKLVDLVNRHLHLQFGVRFSWLLRAAEGFFDQEPAPEALAYHGCEDLYRSIRQISYLSSASHGAVCFLSQVVILRALHEDLEKTEQLFQAFYHNVADELALSDEERHTLEQLIRYNVAFGPKLADDRRALSFDYDFKSYSEQMLRHWVDPSAEAPRLSAVGRRYLFEARAVDPPEDIYWMGAARRAEVRDLSADRPPSWSTH